MEDCSYCKERDGKSKKYYKGIEEEKIRECFKSLEREKIANGMRSTKKTEVALKQFQKLQIEEKKQIDDEKNNIELMWHQTMLDNVNRMEQLERIESQRRNEEMLERRRAYDEQIASATIKRNEIIQEEREKETRRLETIRKKMEEDYYEEIKKKEIQQVENRKNFLEGHKIKMSRLRNERIKEKEIDNKNIRDDLEQLCKEREKKLLNMRKLQLESQIFTENYKRERQLELNLEKESDNITNEWRIQEEIKANEFYRRLEEHKQSLKQKNIEEYNKFKENLKEKHILAKLKQNEAAQEVKRIALKELQAKMYSAKIELKSQFDYRNNITKQLILNNQKHMKSKLMDRERIAVPFTKNVTIFADVMRKNFDKSPGRTSTNPVHPFRRIIESKETNDLRQLPMI